MQKEDKEEQPEADKRKEWDYHLRHQQWQEYKPKEWVHNYKTRYHK